MARRVSRAEATESHRTNFYERGAASPENFIFGLIHVYSLNSWFKCSASGHPRRRAHWFSQRIRCLKLYELEAPPLCYGAPIGSDRNDASKWSCLRTGETPMLHWVCFLCFQSTSVILELFLICGLTEHINIFE